MSVFLDISAALDGRLNTMTGKPAVSWENVSYTPVNGTLYIRPTLLAGDTNQASLGDSGTDQNIGIYQLDVFAPAGTGKGAAIVMADTIANQFKRGTVLTYSGVTVRVKNASRQAAINNADGWYQVPVVVTYISYTQPRT